MIDIAYISIPKTASRSVHSWLISNGRMDATTKNHESIYNYKDEVGFSFAFVREPVERLISWYCHGKDMMHGFYLRNQDEYQRMKMYNCTFSEWINGGCKTHWSDGMSNSLGINSPLNQCDFVCKDGVIDVDYLGVFSRIDSQMTSIASKLNMPYTNLPVITFNKKENVIVDPQTMIRIRDMFKNDFSLYEKVTQNYHLNKGVKIF